MFQRVGDYLNYTTNNRLDNQQQTERIDKNMSTQNNNFASFKLAPLNQIVKPESGFFLYRKSDLNIKETTLKKYESPQDVAYNHPTLAEITSKSQQDYLEAQYVCNLMKAVQELDTYNMNLDKKSIDYLFREINGICEDKNKTSKKPNIIFMSPKVANCIINLDKLYFENLISRETNKNNIYYVHLMKDFESYPESIVSLAYWFATRLALVLVIEEKVGLNNEGYAEFIVGNTVILAHIQTGFESSCFKTIYDGEEFFNQVYEDGKVKTVATYSVEVTDPQMGLRIEVQM